MSKILRLYSNGVWQGNPDRTITVKGEKHNLDEYAKEQGIELPDGKKTKVLKPFKKQVNSYADMGQTFDEGHPEVDGDGDSQGEE